MRAVILQSAYMPWLGYFDLIDKSDVFVFLDCVQWTKQDWRNRNRIRTRDGWKWFTVPVTYDGKYYENSIHEIAIDNSRSWWLDHLNLLHANYRYTPHFGDIFHRVSGILSLRHERICNLNYDLIMMLCDYLGIRYKFAYSQEMNINPEIKRDDRLLAILSVVEADIYLSGQAAKAYMDEEKFDRAGIRVEWHDYKHPYYTQQDSGIFISYLSVLDLLFNHGPESGDILLGRKALPRPGNVIVRKAYE